jgi:hypothetical protein
MDRASAQHVSTVLDSSGSPMDGASDGNHCKGSSKRCRRKGGIDVLRQQRRRRLGVPVGDRRHLLLVVVLVNAVVLRLDRRRADASGAAPNFNGGQELPQGLMELIVG